MEHIVSLLLLIDFVICIFCYRISCIEKVNVLLKFCSESGMVINERKTKLMVINGNRDDRQSISATESGFSVQIDHCEKYCYLGAWFTCDGKLSMAIQQHAKDKYKH